MKKGDILVGVAVLVLAGVLYGSGLLRPSQAGAVAVVYVDGTEVHRLPLSVNDQWRLETTQGYNEIVVEDGAVFVEEADCRDGVCVDHAPVSLEKESIVCLPHKMVIEVEGGATGVDAVVQ